MGDKRKTTSRIQLAFMLEQPAHRKTAAFLDLLGRNKTNITALIIDRFLREQGIEKPATLSDKELERIRLMLYATENEPVVKSNGISIQDIERIIDEKVQYAVEKEIEKLKSENVFSENILKKNKPIKEKTEDIQEEAIQADEEDDMEEDGLNTEMLSGLNVFY